MLNRATYRKKAQKWDDTLLRKRIKEIAYTRVRYGYLRIYILLRREGWIVNHKRVHRIYKEEYLSLRIKRPKRRVSAAQRIARPEVSKIDQCWSMDFVSDQLFNGRKIRALTVVDNYSRECVVIAVDFALKGEEVSKQFRNVRF